MTWQDASNFTLSNSNRTATSTNSSWKSVRSVTGRTGGKFYAEVLVVNGTSANVLIGVGTSSASLLTYIGGDASGWGYYNSSPARRWHNNVGADWGNTYTSGDVIGIAIDTNAGHIWWSKNGTWQAGGDPAAGTGAAYTNLPSASDLFIHASLFPIDGSVTSQFADTQQTYTPPSGFSSWEISARVSGVITDADGNPAARIVRAYRRDTGALIVSTTSDAVTGEYELILPDTNEIQRIVLDDDAAPLYNDLIDRVIPQ
jgi:hypothetical protein